MDKLDKGEKERNKNFRKETYNLQVLHLQKNNFSGIYWGLS